MYAEVAAAEAEDEADLRAMVDRVAEAAGTLATSGERPRPATSAVGR